MSFPRLACLAPLMVLAMPLMTAACGLPLALTAASYGADGASLATTQKTTADHLVSMASKKDCAIWRMFRNTPMCKEREEGAPDPYNVDYSTADRTVSEGGVQYLPPPHAAANAPAASWDAAAYKPAAAPARPPEPMMTADATLPPAVEAPLAPPPATVTPAPPAHPKKVARSGKPVNAVKIPKKASPDPAATAL